MTFQGPEQSSPDVSCLPLWLEMQAARMTGPAMIAEGRGPLSYRELFSLVEETLEALNRMGVGRDQRVAVVLPNGPEMAAALVAVSSAATSAPLNPGYRRSEFDFYLADLNASALIIQAGMDSPAREAA